MHINPRYPRTSRKEIDMEFHPHSINHVLSKAYVKSGLNLNSDDMAKLIGLQTEELFQHFAPIGQGKLVEAMLLRAYMDANKIPYQTVGDDNIENIKKYLCEKKVMPAHLMPKYIVEKYGLIDNQPSIEEAEKETKRLQDLANKAHQESERKIT